MAKTNFTQATYDTNNIQSQNDQVKGQATAIKLAFDQTGIDSKTFTNTSLIAELEQTTPGDSGANKIGINATGVAADNINDAVAEVQANVAGATLGLIPDNTITEQKMAADMKKQAGGTYPFDSGQTNADNIAQNVLDIEANATEIEKLEDIRVATDTTGSTNAYILTLGKDFDFTLDGNVLRINPNFTNTGTSTIAVNGTTKAIRKFDVDTDAYVILEADDIKKNQFLELRFDVSEDFFVLAPKGGAGINVKSRQSGLTLTDNTNSFDITISAVDTSNSIVLIRAFSTGSGNYVNSNAYAEFKDSTTITVKRGSGTNSYLNVFWEVIEYNKVKSIQTGIYTPISPEAIEDVTVTSVDPNNSIVYNSGSVSSSGSSASTTLRERYASTIKNATTISLISYSTQIQLHWTLVEF